MYSFCLDTGVESLGHISVLLYFCPEKLFLGGGHISLICGQLTLWDLSGFGPWMKKRGPWEACASPAVYLPLPWGELAALRGGSAGPPR